jgi:hypothetical protein
MWGFLCTWNTKTRNNDTSNNRTNNQKEKYDGDYISPKDTKPTTAMITSSQYASFLAFYTTKKSKTRFKENV